MTDQESRWVVRLTPLAGTSLDLVLNSSIGLDVWESRADLIVAAATDLQLLEIKRRRLAEVEKLYSVAEFLSRRSDESKG
jgi:hypothetical protein